MECRNSFEQFDLKPFFVGNNTADLQLDQILMRHIFCKVILINTTEIIGHNCLNKHKIVILDAIKSDCMALKTKPTDILSLSSNIYDE